MPATDELVYSHDRVRRLRVVVWVALVVGVLLGGLAAWILAGVLPDDPDALTYAVMLTVATTAVLGSSATALRLLPTRTVQARRACVATGVVLVPCSFLLGPLGFVSILLGLSLLFLALIADDPDLQVRR